MRPLTAIILICTLICVEVLFAQNNQEEDAQESLLYHIESFMEIEEDGMDHAFLAESLEWLWAHPVNLNSATADELRQLFMLSDLQINRLLRHIREHGQLISIYELQTVDGFDIHTIRSILPFVTIAEGPPRRHFSLDNLLRDGENVLFVRYQRLLEQQEGFSPIAPEALDANPNARYLGSPGRLYARYRFTYYQNVSLGITAEKDPGEEFFRGTQPQGFDFYSAHLLLRDFGRLKALSVGDYLVQFGQGLTLWTGMGFGKSGEAIGVKKNGAGLRQYTSVDENNFLRGLGATIQMGPFEVTAFCSAKHRDANVVEYENNENDIPVITSLQQSGLHRTPRELEGKNAVREIILGGHMAYKGQSLSVGLTGYQMTLGADFRRNLSYYNQFDFSSSQYRCLGIDYSYLARNVNLFGEVAIGDNGRMAFLNGMMISLHQSFSLAIVHRHYHRAYQAPMAAAFGENTRASNEEGIYAGASIHLSPTLRLYAFADHFRFPWMKFRTHMPSQGSDYLVNIHYRPTRETEVIARFRRKNKPLNAKGPGKIRHLDDVTRTQYRLHIAYPITPTLSLRNRLEVIRHQYGSELQKGFLIYQDILYRNLNSPFAITLRYALFDTDGFDARIYAYEHDVLYAFSFPFYSDKGMRCYLLVRYRVHRRVDLYMRLAKTFYTNRDHSGSGLDRIEGNTRTEVKAQLRYRF